MSILLFVGRSAYYCSGAAGHIGEVAGRRSPVSGAEVFRLMNRDLATEAPVDRIPSAVSAAQGYDSMYLIANAIQQAGSTDGPNRTGKPCYRPGLPLPHGEVAWRGAFAPGAASENVSVLISRNWPRGFHEKAINRQGRPCALRRNA